MMIEGGVSLELKRKKCAAGRRERWGWSVGTGCDAEQRLVLGGLWWQWARRRWGQVRGEYGMMWDAGAQGGVRWAAQC